MRSEAVGGDGGQIVGNGFCLFCLLVIKLDRISRVAFGIFGPCFVFFLLLPRLVSLALQLFSKFNRNNVRRNCIPSNQSFPSFGIRLWCWSSAHSSLSKVRAFTIKRLAFSMRSKKTSCAPMSRLYSGGRV